MKILQLEAQEFECLLWKEMIKQGFGIVFNKKDLYKIYINSQSDPELGKIICLRGIIIPISQNFGD